MPEYTVTVTSLKRYTVTAPTPANARVTAVKMAEEEVPWDEVVETTAELTRPDPPPAKPAAVTRTTRRRVAAALGYTPDDESIVEALAEHNGVSAQSLLTQFRLKLEVFERGGCRGMELADEIDAMRIALAARGVAFD